MNQATDRLELIAKLRTAVQPVMDVTGYRFEDGPSGVADSVVLVGRLKLPLRLAYRPLRHALERVGYTPFLRDAQSPMPSAPYEVLARPGVFPRAPQNPFIPLALFVATVVSVVLSGSAVSADGENLDLLHGLMFAASLLGILGVHELGHYVVAKRRGAPVSLPYFIPLPFVSFVGTLGAVIIQREPLEDRQTILEVAIAGPLAGFLLAVPLLALGYALSEVKAIPAGEVTTFGDSLLTRAVGFLAFGKFYPRDGFDIFLHPVAFGAWIGLLITGINLIPAGQLDGGHIAYAVLGERAKYLSWVMIGLTFALALVSQSYLLWAVLLLVFARSHPPPMNQALKLEPVHYALALIGVLMFVLVFVPQPVY